MYGHSTENNAPEKSRMDADTSQLTYKKFSVWKCDGATFLRLQWKINSIDVAKAAGMDAATSKLK